MRPLPIPRSISSLALCAALACSILTLAGPAQARLPDGPPGGGAGETSRPPDACEPTVQQAELRGTLRLPDFPYKAPVGANVRVALETGRIFVPTKPSSCEGRGHDVPIPSSITWSLSARPEGSAATLAAAPGYNATFTPDVPGDYTVRVTACPEGCTLDGVQVPPVSMETAFAAIEAGETRLSSDQFEALLASGLRDTRLVLSHTGEGAPITTRRTVRWNIPSYKFQQLTNCERYTGKAAERCEERAERLLKRAGTTSLIEVSQWHKSYIDFGPTAELAGAPAVSPLAIKVPELELPTAARAAIILGNPVQAGLLASLDVDRVRLLLNNIHQTFTGNVIASIRDGRLRVSTTLETGRPAVVCEAHYKVKTGYYLSITQGWSDTLCPDFDLQPIKVELALVPSVDSAGRLYVGSPEAALDLKPRGFTSPLIDLVADATGRMAVRIRKQLARAWDRGGCKSGAKAIGSAVRGFAISANHLSTLGPILSAEVVGNELLIRYEPAESNHEPKC